MEIQKTPGWLDWYDGPSKPRFKVPAGSVDAHCHVFGPGAEFPYAPERKYTPCDASKHQLYALRDHLGFARNVVVQATCHGADNRAMVDALVHSNGKARGVATVKRSVTDAELQAMHDAGLRIYLATSKREMFARRILEHLGLASYFRAIHGSVPSGALDHKPELLAHILAERNIAAPDSLMVGDRRHDVAGAHAVRMRSLGVLWGYGSRDELEAAGADRLVENPADLAGTVLAMLRR